jgi:hypothetical protein
VARGKESDDPGAGEDHPGADPDEADVTSDEGDGGEWGERHVGQGLERLVDGHDAPVGGYGGVAL